MWFGFILDSDWRAEKHFYCEVSILTVCLSECWERGRGVGLVGGTFEGFVLLESTD